MLSRDIAFLLKLSMREGPRVLLKDLANELFLAPSEVSRAVSRCRNSGLLYWSDAEKRVNRSGLLEFIAHGIKYVFPPERGAPVRGIPTAFAAPPLSSFFLPYNELLPVWPYAVGDVRGFSFAPLYKGAPKAALRDPKFYELLALTDAARGGKARERALALELLEKELNANR